MEVKPEEIEESGSGANCEFLLSFFSKNTYNAWDTHTHPKVHHVMQRCLDLFGLDYKYSVVSNSNGELSSNYPSSLIILEGEKNHDEILSTPTNGVLDGSSSNGDSHVSITNSSSSNEGFNNPIHQELPKMKDLILKSRYARCRARFPVPVILYNDKHICRSSTLSGGPEMIYRSSFDYFFSGSSTSSSSSTNNITSSSSITDSTIFQNETPSASTITTTTTPAATPSTPVEEEGISPDTEGQGDWQLFDRVRNQDIRLLKSLQVNTIVDLMVEKKKVKFGVNVTSSEKVDKKNRYGNFRLISLPYPGCEFFRQYRDNDYNAEALMFEWTQSHVDANIFVPSDDLTDKLNLEWSQYRTWDLIRLTQNYLKIILAYLRGEKTGLLIHCISGWDRTPLFVSLLRLSLWADGVIHKSLSAEQILFLTLAYDWLLFGHNLEDRLNKGEEILYFCFYFLTHIIDPEYSIDYESPNQPTSTTTDSESLSCNNPDIPLETESPASLKDFHQTVNSCSNDSDEQNLNGKDNTANGDECPTINTTTTTSVNNHDSKIQDYNNGAREINGINGLPEVTCSNAHSQNHEIIESDSANHSQSINGSIANIPNGNHQNGIEFVSTNSERQNGDADCSESSNNCSTLKAETESTPENHNSNGNVNGEIHQEDSTAPNESNDDVNVIPLSIKETHNSLPGSTTTTTTTTENGNSEDSLTSVPLSKRNERLRLVRSHFYALYNTTIGSPSRHGNDNYTGGGSLSVIIDNIATKVGIRGNRVSS